MQQQSVDDIIRRWYDDWFTVNRIYIEWAQRRGMTATTLFILWAVDEHATRGNGNCTLRFLCEKLSLPKQTVASALDALEKKGLLIKLPGSKDKRNKLIRFTPEGQAYADQILEEVRTAERKVFGMFDRYRLEAITEGYHRMTVLLEKALSEAPE